MHPDNIPCLTAAHIDCEGITGHARYRVDLALLYLVTLDRTTGELRRLKMIPMRRQRFRLNTARREDVDWLCATLDRESRRLGTGVSCPLDGSLLLDWT